MDWASKGGQGIAVATSGAVSVGALMAVNALGSVHGEDGRVLAGCRAPAGHPRYPHAPLGSAPDETSLSNTVIGCVVTNARLDKAAACRVADLSHTGIARAVRPAHTPYDGDVVFAIATAAQPVAKDLRLRAGHIAEIGAAAGDCLARAIARAVYEAANRSVD